MGVEVRKFKNISTLKICSDSPIEDWKPVVNSIRP